MDIIGDEVFTFGRNVQAARVSEGVVHVGQPHGPVPLHALGTELGVLVLTLTGFVLVDELNHIEVGAHGLFCHLVKERVSFAN